MSQLRHCHKKADTGMPTNGHGYVPNCFVCKNCWFPNLAPWAKVYSPWFWNPLIFLMPRGKAYHKHQGVSYLKKPSDAN